MYAAIPGESMCFLNFYPGGGKVVNASQEMIALGMCNIFGSFMGSMPVAGSMTRSALNHTTGVRTTFSSIFTCEYTRREPVPEKQHFLTHPLGLEFMRVKKSKNKLISSFKYVVIKILVLCHKVLIILYGKFKIQKRKHFF